MPNFKVLAIASLLLIGCNGASNQQIGTIAGTAGGALIGSQFASSTGGKIIGGLIGASVGGVIGNTIGNKLDEKSRIKMEQATYYGLDKGLNGQSYNWSSDSVSGSFKPTLDYQDSYGRYCREYTQTIKIGNKTENAYGKACRMPDGSWKVQN